MKDLLDRVDDVIATQSLPWRREGDRVRVDLRRRARAQAVHLARVDDRYVFRSPVLPSSEVTQTDRRWRDLAYRAWRRNAAKDIVTFSFDEHDALIGVIDVPAATLNQEELRMYIEILAKECDRFEYALTGEDVE